MGCPDWPTCFGQWVPPTSETQLPSNYQEIYADLGYADTRFNVVKTWTEYLNRLIGVGIGLLIFLTAFFLAPSSLRQFYFYSVPSGISDGRFPRMAGIKSREF